VRNFIKFLLTLVMTGVLLTTGVVYAGAATSKGKLSILAVGLSTYLLMGLYYSWFANRPATIRDCFNQ
jgi:heme/copper-type cytochrome/quinol oxidase subunit 3